MAPLLGHLLCRLGPRGLTGFVAVVVALALVGAPALADTNPILASLAQNDQPTRPGEDDDVTPDAVYCSRPAPVRHGPDGPRDRRTDRAVSAPPSGPSHAANPVRSPLADPSGNGAGVRLRC